MVQPALPFSQSKTAELIGGLSPTAEDAAKDGENESEASSTDGSGESGSGGERRLATTHLTTEETARGKIAGEKYTEEEGGGRKASLVLPISPSDLEDEIEMDGNGVASKPRIIGSAAEGDVRRLFEPRFVAAAAVIAAVAAASGAAAAFTLWCLLSPSSNRSREELLEFFRLFSTESHQLLRYTLSLL